MKVCVVTTTRFDNLYLNEWINFYKTIIKVDNIFLGDINNNNEHDPKWIIDNDLKSGFVIYEKLKYSQNNDFNIIKNYYNDIYVKYKNEYDWFCFFNIDEYLSLSSDIKTWLSYEKFKEYDSILVNWRIMSDENNLLYDDTPLKERFTHDAKGFVFHNYYNYHFKSIIKNSLGDLTNYDINYVPNSKKCDIYGNKIDDSDIIDHRTSTYKVDITLQYYWFKSVQEIFDLKILVNKVSNYYEMGCNTKQDFLEQILSLYFYNCNFEYNKYDIIKTYLLHYNIKPITKQAINNYNTDDEICLE